MARKAIEFGLNEILSVSLLFERDCPRIDGIPLEIKQILIGEERTIAREWWGRKLSITGDYPHEEFNEETLRIEFNELPVYWLLSVDRCVNRSWLKRGRGQAFRSEGGTTDRKPVFLPSFSRVGFAPCACKDDAGESSLLSFPLFSFLSERSEAEREREREMERGDGEKRRGQ